MSQFAMSVSARANGRQVSCNEGFKIGWRHIPAEELPTNMYAGREIDTIVMLSAALLDDYVRGNQFGEVVHRKSGEDFLQDVLHLFCVKMEQSNRMFEIAKRRFNAPTQRVELL